MQWYMQLSLTSSSNNDNQKKPSKSDKLFYENEHSMQTHGTT